MSEDTRSQEEKDALLALYDRQAMPKCASCGHAEASHSDGLPDDPHRLCILCRECEGFRAE